MRWLLRPLVIYGASRVVILLAFFLAVTAAGQLGHDLSAGRPWPAPPAGQSPTLTALTAWDGAWYTQIAQRGYGGRSSVMAFFPAYPLATRALSAVTGLGRPAAGVLVAGLFGALAAILLWRLSCALGDEPFADRSTALFAFAPGSFVFSMAYAEPLMLAASIGCLLSLYRQRWLWAGVWGAVATAARPNAGVLVVACAWAAVVAVRRSGAWKALAAPLLCAGGIAAYFAFLWRRTGVVLAWFDVERNIWKDTYSLASPWTRAQHALSQLTGGGRGPDLNYVVPTLGLVCAAVTIFWLARWRPPPALIIYAVGIVVLAAGSARLGVRPRFLATAFPLMQAVAWRFRGTACWVTVAVCAALAAVLTFVTVLTLLAVP